MDVQADRCNVTRVVEREELLAEIILRLNFIFCDINLF